MSEFWYYAEGNETRGPITFETLIKLLSQLPTPRGVLVWREGFDDWTAAENISEIVEKLIRPPPLPRPSMIARSEERFPAVTETTPKDMAADREGLDAVVRNQQQFRKVNPELSSDHNANTRGRTAFLVVFIIVISVGAYFTNQVYNNSINGTANLIGQLLGAWFVLTLLTWWLRKLPYTAAVVLAVAALSVGLSNRGKLQAVWDSKIAFQAMADPTQLDKTLSQNPENKVLKLVAMANKVTEETNTAAAKLSDEIEPPALSKDINFATVTRNDLEGIRRDLKTAETNATTYMPRYLALLKAERQKIEASAQPLDVDKGTVNSFLVGLDKGRVKYLTFSSSMMLANSEFYRAYGNYVAFLIENFNAYNVDTNGQILFAQKQATDRYSVLSVEMKAKALRVSELDDERKKLELQAQQERRESFVNGK
jgi:hypothetical protein